MVPAECVGDRVSGWTRKSTSVAKSVAVGASAPETGSVGSVPTVSNRRMTVVPESGEESIWIEPPDRSMIRHTVGRPYPPWAPFLVVKSGSKACSIASFVKPTPSSLTMIDVVASTLSPGRPGHRLTGRHRDVTGPLDGVDGVGDEVHQHLAEPDVVDEDERRSGRRLDAQCDPGTDHAA